MAVRRHKRPGAEQHLYVQYVPKDMLNGCQVLTAVEELAYRRLCDLIYVTGDRVVDDEALAEFTRAGDQWPAVRASLLKKKKLRLARTRLTNDRCQKEIAAASARKVRAQRGAKVRHDTTESVDDNPLDGKDIVTPSKPQAVLGGLLEPCQRLTTKEESKKEEEEGSGTAPSGAASDYGFAGKVIRLKWQAFARWVEAFRHLDLRAELTGRDDWLATLPVDDRRRKDWYIPTSNWLIRKNDEAMRSRSGADAVDLDVLH